MNFPFLGLVLLVLLSLTNSKIVDDSDRPGLLSPSVSNIGRGQFIDGFRRRCPICDSSVYSYCTEKLFHDSCCCYNPNNPYDNVPFQCQFADCSFLHANSCPEHKLITACCCTNYLF